MAGGEADNKLRLLKIAMEGFNMLDACGHRPNGRNGWAVEARQQKEDVAQARVYHQINQAAPVKAAAAGNSITDSNEAAKMYGGMLIAEYQKKVIDSNEAARMYGGMLIAEYPKERLRLFV